MGTVTAVWIPARGCCFYPNDQRNRHRIHALVLAIFLFRFITTTATGGALVVSFVLLTELVGEEWRETISVLNHVPFQIAYIILPVLSWSVRHWRYLQLLVSVLYVILLTYYWWIPVSPRWLFAIGRIDEAASILEDVACGL